MKKNYIIFIAVLLVLSSIVFAQNIIIRSNSKDTNLYLSLGDFLYKRGYEEQALKAYEKAYQLDPQNKAVLNNLGHYYKDKNPLMAEDYFIQALEVDQGYEKARNNLALLYYKNEQYGNAVEHLRILVEDYPKSIQYNYDLAINLAHKFRYEGFLYDDLVEAIKLFKMVYEMDPSFEHAKENLLVLENIRRTIV